MRELLFLAQKKCSTVDKEVGASKDQFSHLVNLILPSPQTFELILFPRKTYDDLLQDKLKEISVIDEEFVVLNCKIIGEELSFVFELLIGIKNLV